MQEETYRVELNEAKYAVLALVTGLQTGHAITPVPVFLLFTDIEKF